MRIAPIHVFGAALGALDGFRVAPAAKTRYPLAQRGEAMRILTEPISPEELQQLAAETFGNLVKAVVDVGRGIIAIGGELHSDEEALLLENGSSQEDLWGINLFPEIPGDEWIEFDSMINIRPLRGNKSRGVDDPQTRLRIAAAVNAMIKR